MAILIKDIQLQQTKGIINKSNKAKRRKKTEQKLFSF